jgi:hypothetical protein
MISLRFDEARAQFPRLRDGMSEGRLLWWPTHVRHSASIRNSDGVIALPL